MALLCWIVKIGQDLVTEYQLQLITQDTVLGFLMKSHVNSQGHQYCERVKQRVMLPISVH